VLVALGGGACAAGNENEPKGPERGPAQLTPAAAGVQIRPILSAGEKVGTYQMSGIPDGLGAYAGGGPSAQGGGGEGLQVLMNHELEGDKPSGVGARVSQLALDRNARRVRAARYALDGSEGFLRFCSATLATLDGRRLFLTGEESTDDGDLTSARDDGLGRGGSSIALDPKTGRYRETRHFGLLPHENLVPVDGLDQAVVLTTEDGEPGENESQLYAFIAPSFRDAIAGRRGSLHVWKADRRSESDADPSTDDIAEGERVRGRFVPLSEKDNADADALEDAAQAEDAFDFERLEDAAISRTADGSLHIADTGAAGSESVRGRLYRFDFERSDPRRATLTLELDADAQALRPDPVKLVNPDNLDVSARSLVIQEDRNEEHRGPEIEGGYGRVLVYDLATRRLRAVARVSTPSQLKPGEWESSGVINASDLLGPGRWLLDVQAHERTAPQPGPRLAPSSSSGEAGQLIEITIPGS
jgi:hypothetical protein